MLIMKMGMFVLYDLVGMGMFMAFGQMQPESQRHQNSRASELDGHWFAEQDEGHQGADERGQ
jgi:hypothetical protein